MLVGKGYRLTYDSFNEKNVYWMFKTHLVFNETYVFMFEIRAVQMKHMFLGCLKPI